ncbi:MarR family transcriptional regulator [uncultured Roseibium sp.]|uniref:MarR family winged helix-turn-helix transcriptional regulator n=1 Tax=uncultured Roseibium sp. TaxID=1936171 RepID=UPI003217F61B
MTEDIVRQLGYMTLGTRLKRIGERLQAQTQTLISEQDSPEAGSVNSPVLAALSRNGPLSIGDLTQAIGQSQPGITRMVGKLKARGLAKIVPDPVDRRVSKVSLTPAGEDLVRRLEEGAWQTVEAAVTDACEGLSGSLLEQLGQLEDRLAARPLPRHVRVRVKAR